MEPASRRIRLFPAKPRHGGTSKHIVSNIGSFERLRKHVKRSGLRRPEMTGMGSWSPTPEKNRSKGSVILILGMRGLVRRYLQVVTFIWHLHMGVLENWVWKFGIVSFPQPFFPFLEGILWVRKNLTHGQPAMSLYETHGNVLRQIIFDSMD